MTEHTERAERLRAAVDAMPPGPSRERFSELAASLEAPASATSDPPAPAPLGWSAPTSTSDAPMFDPFSDSQFATPAPATAAPKRLLPLDDEVLPDDDVLPAAGADDDEVPVGQWRTYAPPMTPWPSDGPVDDDASAEDDPAAETTDDVGVEQQERAPLKIPASRPSPASQPSEPPTRPRRWRRHRAP